jgi:hypothetical protein
MMVHTPLMTVLEGSLMKDSFVSRGWAFVFSRGGSVFRSE